MRTSRDRITMKASRKPLWAALAAVALLLSSCYSRSLPPRGCLKGLLESEKAVTIYAVNHGWHTGIALSAQDLPMGPWLDWLLAPATSFVEIGWGDAEYYPAEKGGVLMGLRALFIPGASVLHRASFNTPLESYFAYAESIVKLQISPSGLLNMLKYMDSSVQRDQKGAPLIAAEGLYGDAVFYNAAGRFSLFNNCNTWSAQALAAAGCPIPKFFITSGALMGAIPGESAKRGQKGQIRTP